MKLNLLPTHVSKGNQFIPGVIVAVIIVVVAALAAMQMKAVSVAARDKAFYAAEDEKPYAQQAVDVAASADQIIAGVAGEIININLMHQMDNHNKVYPEFYDKLFKSIPNYFRITAISAVPNGNDTCTVTMNGVIHTFQQYADIMLALLRVQGAQSITRSGYNLEETIVPPLTPEDQKGIPIKPGIPHLPSKKLDQLDILIGAAHEDGFTGTGGFGTFGIPRTRGAMPHWSAITIGLVMNANLQTPDPLATLDNNKAAYKLQGTRPQVQLAAVTAKQVPPPAGKVPSPARGKPGAAPAGARPGPAIARPGGGPAIARPGGGPPGAARPGPAGAMPGPGGARPGPAGARPGPGVARPGGGK